MEDGEAADGETPRRKPLFKELSQQCMWGMVGAWIVSIERKGKCNKTSMVKKKKVDLETNWHSRGRMGRKWLSDFHPVL